MQEAEAQAAVPGAGHVETEEVQKCEERLESTREASRLFIQKVSESSAH